MPEFNASIRHLHHRFIRIPDIAAFIQHLRNPPDTGHTHRNHNKDHGQHHKTHQNIHTIRKQTHQFPGGKRRRNDHLRPDPADQKNTGVDRKLHKRRIIHQLTFRLHKDLINILACFSELNRLLLLPDICLYDPDRRNILLDRGIHVVIFRKSLLKILRRIAHNQHQHNPKNQHCRQVNVRQLPVNPKSHNHRAQKTCRRTREHPQGHLISVLYIGHIRRKPCYQPGRTVFVNIRK